MSAAPQTPNLDAASRQSWRTTGPTPSIEQLTLGCLQRIANALERVAQAQEALTPRGKAEAAAREAHRQAENLEGSLARTLWSRVYQAAGHPGRCSAGVDSATKRWAYRQTLEARRRDGGELRPDSQRALREAADSAPLAQIAWEDHAPPASLRWLREKFPRGEGAGT